jgi:hypothetical protein
MNMILAPVQHSVFLYVEAKSKALPCIFRSIKRDDKGQLVKELLSPTTHEKLANQIKELIGVN